MKNVSPKSRRGHCAKRPPPGGNTKLFLLAFLVLGCTLTIQTPDSRGKSAPASLTPLWTEKVPKKRLLGEDEASRPPTSRRPPISPFEFLGDYQKLLRVNPTWANDYTQEEIQKAYETFGGSFTPEQMSHLRDLRRLGLAVNTHTATLRPLPKEPVPASDPLPRIQTRSSGTPIQGYGPQVAVGSAPILLQSASVFRFRGSLYPRSLSGHLHAKIPLTSLSEDRKSVV